MWKNINKIIGKSKDKLHSRSLLIDECEISNETDIANTFKNYFTTISPKLNSNIPTTDISPLKKYANNFFISFIFLISSG